MITQNDAVVNEKIDEFALHKNFARTLQNLLSQIYTTKDGHLTSKGENICKCGTSLEFQHFFNEDDTRTLHSANFCKHKLCPMCAWRWHLKQSAILQRTFDLLGKQDFYHLILTIPNVKFMTKEFLIELRQKAVYFMKKVAKSGDYFMSFEITIDKNGYYHPHYHVLYINHLDKPLTRKKIQTEWARIANTGTNYAIALQKPCTSNRISLELTKYILKFDEFEPTRTALQVLSKSTMGIRKISAGGKIAKMRDLAIKQLDKENFDQMQELYKFDSEIEWFKWFDGSYRLEQKSQRKTGKKL